MIHELLLLCLEGHSNYYIFKYLYLLPARNLYYKNVYEELKDIIKDNSSYNLKNTSKNENDFTQKVEYELNEIYKKKDNNDFEEIKRKSNVHNEIINDIKLITMSISKNENHFCNNYNVITIGNEHKIKLILNDK